MCDTHRLSSGCVAYTAGSGIDLTPGFSTSPGVTFHAVIATPLAITTSLSPGTEGAPYFHTIASGGRPGYTWMESGSPFPPGLALSSSGVLSGTPTQAGLYTPTLTVTDSVCQSVSTTVNILISGAATSTTLSAAPSPSTYGSVITLNATVTKSLSAVPTGYVFFCDASKYTRCNTANMLIFGQVLPTGGTYVATSLYIVPGAGTEYFLATYGGDANYAPSTSATWIETVSRATPTVSLSSTPSSGSASGLGQAVALAAGISPSGAIGTVTFYDGSTALGTVNVTAGSAYFSASGMTLGPHTISANYSGDANNLPATSSSTVSIQIVPGVQLTNFTHPGSTYYAGDSFLLAVSGGANQPVYYNGVQFVANGQPAVTNNLGNGTGVYAVLGTWDASVANAQYSQNWQVGSPTTNALPSPLSFYIYSSGQTTVELVDNSLNKSYLEGQRIYGNTDAFTVNVYGPGNSPVTGNLNGNTPGGVTCSQTGNSNTDSYGLCTVTGGFGGLAAGTYTERWWVNGTEASQSPLTFTLTGSAGTSPTITAVTLPGGIINVSYLTTGGATVTLAATGGTGSYGNWQVPSGLGALPGGLSLNSSTGTITGTPNQPGQFDFSVTVTDSIGNVSTPQPLSITISNPNSPYILTASLPGGRHRHPVLPNGVRGGRLGHGLHMVPFRREFAAWSVNRSIGSDFDYIGNSHFVSQQSLQFFPASQGQQRCLFDFSGVSDCHGISHGIHSFGGAGHCD